MSNIFATLFTKDTFKITYPNVPKFYSCADHILAQIKNPPKREIFDNRIVAAGCHFLVKYCSFFTEQGWCCATDEELIIHHCLWNETKYEVAVLKGAFNRKHKNFKRIDKLALTEIENRYEK